MNCKNCNAVMKVDKEKKMFVCPYCESTEPFQSFSNQELKDELKGIVSEAIRDANKTSGGNGGNGAASQAHGYRDGRTAAQKAKDGVITIMQVVFCIFLAFFSITIFTGDFIGVGAISLAQLVLIIVALVNKSKYRKTGNEKARKTAKLSIIIASVLIIAWMALLLSESSGGGSVSGSGSGSESYKVTWPTQGVGSQLEQMPGKLEHASSRNGEFSASSKSVSLEDFTNYVKACQEAGFTIGATEEDDKYSALDENDNKLEIEYWSYSNGMHVEMIKLDMKPFQWSDQGVAGEVPRPKAEKSYMVSFSNDRYEIYVGEVTREDFMAYAQECIAAGYEGSVYQDSYYGRKDKCSIDVDLECGKIMHIRVNKY